MLNQAISIKKKLLGIFVCFFSSIIVGCGLLLSLHVHADVFKTSFTSDNKGTQFSYSIDGAVTHVNTSGIAGIGQWQYKSDLLLDIKQGSTYEFVWSIVNYGTFGGHNPVAFLAEVGFLGHTYLTNNSNWEVKSAGTADKWVAASLNTTGGTNAANGADNIWASVRPGPVSGISNNSLWIWDGAASGENDTMSFRIVINDKRVVQASSPSIFAIFGGALLFVTFKSKRSKSKRV